MVWKKKVFKPTRVGGLMLRRGVQLASALASNYVNRHYGSRTTTRSGRKGIDAGGTSTQRDVKTIYRKKSMPRYKKKTWKKFVKKVQAVNEMETGTTTRNIISNISTSVSPLGQSFVSTHLYGYTGADASGEAGSGDMNFIAFTDLALNRTDYDVPAPNSDMYKLTGAWDNKIKFISARLQLDIHNTGSQPVICDMYFLEYNKKSVDSRLNLAFSVGYDISSIVRPPSGSTPPKTQLTQYGVSLFDMGEAISRGGFTVKKVKSYQIPAGDIVTEQIRDPRTYIVDMQLLQADTAKFAHPKYTETLLLVYRNPDTEASATVQCTAVRSYKYQIHGVNRTATAYTS